ncbi:MAG: Xylose isomerase-like barrel, partial [Pedosphaera sp.]|nr:Xylose isomerase-like barrel [Pedosphaera sp.]
MVRPPMKTMNYHPDRRTFLKTAAVAGAGLAFLGIAGAQSQGVGQPKKIKLGFDNFAVRAMGWKAHALLDYAASLKLDSLLISDLDAFENHTEAYFKEVK